MIRTQRREYSGEDERVYWRVSVTEKGRRMVIVREREARGVNRDVTFRRT